MTDTHFKRALVAEGFTICEMDKDGNCLFSAIAMALFGETDAGLVRWIRNDITFQMRSNQPHLEDVQIPADYEREVQHAERDGYWGSALHIRIASELYERNFVVIGWDNANGWTYSTRFPDPLTYTDTSYLSYHNNSHYNFLRRGVPEQQLLRDRNMEEVKFCDTSENISKDSSDENNSSSVFDIADVKDIMDPDEIEAAYIPNDCGYESTGGGIDAQNNGFSSTIDVDTDASTIVDTDEDAEEDADEDAGKDEHFGINFVGQKAFQSGRKCVYLIIMVPKEFKLATLIDSIKSVKGRADIYYTASYKYDILESIKNDILLNRMYDIWIANKSFPLRDKTSTIKAWYSKMMIPHVLLTTIGFISLTEPIKFLFHPGQRCLIPVLVKECWSRFKNDVVQDMRLILNNQYNVFCENCTLECTSRCKPWHINLNHFVLHSESPKENTFIFTRMNAIKEGRHHPKLAVAPFVKNLCYIFKSLDTQDEKLSKSYAVLNKFTNRRKTFNSYLLLIVDGPNMTPETNFKDIENDKSFFKSLYAGQTCYGSYRNTHFGQSVDSPIQKVLSSTSKVYLLRSKECANRIEVLRDEAIVLEILTLTLQTAKQNSRDAPFILLNKNSGASAFLNIDEDSKMKILQLCKAETPIFSGSICNTTNEVEDFFKGHYYVGEPLDVPKSTTAFCSDLYKPYI